MIPRHPLFQRHGVELEYMIVGADDLEVRPLADRLLHDSDGNLENSLERGRMTWSNELAAHVLEIKTTDPEPSLDGLAELFQEEVREIDRRLAAHGARLLPSAMHPWMDPLRETVLWPHGDRAIYDAFHRIFDCRGHGWSNLQSVHLNLPFQDDTEFARLHAAIRLVLPLLPALAASSPLVEGRWGGNLDNRLEFYRHNCARLPTVTGRVVPETVSSRLEYEDRILAPMYRAIAPLDPEGILQDEWLNARGAIARFERYTIEVRVIDLQECPRADLAILQLLTAVLRRLTSGEVSSLADQQAPTLAELEAVLLGTIAQAGAAIIACPALCRGLGLPETHPRPAAEIWGELLARDGPPDAAWPATAAFLLREGCLAQRLRRALGPAPDRAALHATYRQLADCLRQGRLFQP